MNELSIFSQNSFRYQTHLTNQEFVSCRFCNRPFCGTTRCRQHERSQHHQPPATPGSTTVEGEGIDLDIPIIGDTKYQKQKGYLAEEKKNMSQIRDRTKNKANWKRINRKIEPGFTYRLEADAGKCASD